VGGTYPTSRWERGQVVADSYRIHLPDALPSGKYAIIVAAGTSPAAVDLNQESVERVLLEQIEVQKLLRWPSAELGVSVRRRCGDGLVLLGYDAPPTLAPGHVTDIAVQFGVVDERGDRPLPTLSVRHADGTMDHIPMWRNNAADWQRGARVVAQWTVRGSEGFEGAEIRGDGWAYRLPTRLVAASPPIADFGAIQLSEYRYGARSVTAGGTVHLTLEWQPTAGISERYKVFVHVLGQNGLPIAQQDNEPVGGTYPTTRWRRGERIRDPYAIVLPQGLPEGEYAVEVGLYRISDLTRLSVLDETGAAIDDKVYLEPIVVQ
jgi:hypothetical protein